MRLLTQGLHQEVGQLPAMSEEVLEVALGKSNLALRLGLPLCRLLRQEVQRSPPVLLHDHGIWSPANHYAAITARKLNVPFLVHPRGLLEPWALEYRGWKKRLALRLYQRRDLESAALLFATAEQEAESIRRLGLRQPVAVIPNGIQTDLEETDKPSRMSRHVRNALFLSRIHSKKGLINLIQAWGRLRPMNWRLCIAGPDEGGHWAEVLAEARKAGIEQSIEYLGEVVGAEKARAYRNADLFVLPTFSENFGVVVAEALSYGLPVITTKGAPWGDLVRHSCGWWIDIGVEPLAAALKHALGLSDEERGDMGKRGRIYAQRFGWNDIAKQTVEVYRWILGQARLPNFVYLD